MAETPATGNSTPAVSSGPKLKLTFNTGGSGLKESAASGGNAADNGDGDDDDEEEEDEEEEEL